MNATRLGELAARAGYDASGGPDPLVTDVVTDSRAAGPGAMFVAVRGVGQDGRAFIHDAVGRGAVAVALSGDHPVPGGVARLAVDSDRVAAARLAAAFHDDPSRRLDVVGITGTNGKTTTAWMLEAALTGAGSAPALLGTIRTRVGLRDEISPCTTPGPAEFQRLLAEARTAGHRHVVAEVSSHALDQGRLLGTRLAVAVITNVTRDHLDYHGTQAAYAAAKARILELVASDGVVVINADDPGACAVAGITGPGALLRCSLRDRDADVHGALRVGVGGTTLEITSAGERALIRPPLGGEHNASNVLVAVAAARGLGVPLVDAVRGLETMAPVPGRMERVSGAPFDVVVDYAHTPDAFERVLAALRRTTKGRLLVVFGCGGDKDRGKRPLMGRVAARDADMVVVTADNPRSETPGAIADAVVAGMSTPTVALVVHDRSAAIEHVLHVAREDDCVVLLGKGHETEQDFGKLRIPHDDRDAVRRWVARREAIGIREARSC